MARCVGVAAGFGDLPDSSPGVAVDDGFVGVGDDDVAVGDVTDVGGVGEDAGDGQAGPFLCRCGFAGRGG